MKNISNKLGILTLASLLTLSSCNESFLDAVPETSLSDATVFATPDRILSQINGIYSSAKIGALFGGRYQIYNDIRAEEFINRTTNTVTGYTTYQANQEPSDSYIANFWINGYLAINRANLFLEGIDKAQGVISTDLATNYKGEAKFVRALSYFALVQLFAKPYALDNGASPGLPLRLTGQTTSENNDLALSKVADIYAQILKDLNEAEAELPDNYGSPLLRTTRAHKNSAIALKTRVLLAKKDYQGVISEANKLVPTAAPFKSANRVTHELLADATAPFRAPYTTLENIFSFPMSTNDAPGTQNQIGYYFNAGNVEYYINTGATGIYNNPQFTATDDRKTKLMVPTTTVSAGNPSSIKFSGVSPFIDFVPIIRYAEVLLNLAEAEAEVGSQTRAVALLEAIHTRSNGGAKFTGLDKAGVIKAILTERRIELFAEGFRATDVLRRAEPLNSFGAGAMIQPTDRRYIFDIPLLETQTNNGL